MRRKFVLKPNLFQYLKGARGENDHRPLLDHGVPIPPQAHDEVAPRGGVGKGPGGGVDPHLEGHAPEAHAPDLGGDGEARRWWTESGEKEGGQKAGGGERK